MFALLHRYRPDKYALFITPDFYLFVDTGDGVLEKQVIFKKESILCGYLKFLPKVQVNVLTVFVPNDCFLHCRAEQEGVDDVYL